MRLEDVLVEFAEWLAGYEGDDLRAAAQQFIEEARGNAKP